MKGTQALVTGAGFLLLLLALPFIWLYEQLGGFLFVLIFIVSPLAAWGFIAFRRLQRQSQQQEDESRQKKQQESLVRARAKQIDASDRRALLEKHRAKEAKREQAQNRQSRVHHDEGPYGELSINWRRQFEEIDRAWRDGDYDFARTWLQKLAYRLTSEQAPQAVHDRFKALMAEFTRDDPLYAAVMRLALPVVSETPGVIQSQLAKQFPQFDAEQFRYAMYYGEVIGDVVRVKKGRSYALSIPTQLKARAMVQKIGAEEAAKLLYELFERQSWLLSVTPERHDDPVIERQALSFILSVAENGVTDWGGTTQAVRETVSLLMMDFLARLMHPQSPYAKKTWDVSNVASSFEQIMSIIASEIRISHPTFMTVH